MYKWKPNKAQKEAFKERMNDPEQRAQYEAEKLSKADKRRKSSSFDYEKAGGSYITTKEQYDFCIRNSFCFNEETQRSADMVMFGYVSNEKIQHDHIHVINELRRKYPTL